MKKLLVVACCSLLAGPAVAGNVYLGGSWGKATYTLQGPGASADTDDSGFKLYAGYRIIKWLGVEAAYTDLLTGKETAMGFDFAVAANYGSASAVGLLPLHPRFELWGKLGAARWNTDVSVDDGMSPPIDNSSSGIGVGYGVGFDGYVSRRLGFRVEWEAFDFEDVEDVRYLSAGLIYRFGKH